MVVLTSVCSEVGRLMGDIDSRFPHRSSTTGSNIAAAANTKSATNEKLFSNKH